MYQMAANVEMIVGGIAGAERQYHLSHHSSPHFYPFLSLTPSYTTTYVATLSLPGSRRDRRWSRYSQYIPLPVELLLYRIPQHTPEPSIYFHNIPPLPLNSVIMEITRKSQYSGKTRTLDLPVTQAQLDDFNRGTKVQIAFPELSADQREFILTGITHQEWEEMFPPEEE
jgi:hypothetical protein